MIVARVIGVCHLQLEEPLYELQEIEDHAMPTFPKKLALAHDGERLQGGPEPSSKWAQQTTTNAIPRETGTVSGNVWGIMTQMISSKVGNCQSLWFWISRTNGADFLLNQREAPLVFVGLVRELLSPSLPSQWLNTHFFFLGGGGGKKRLFQDAVDLGDSEFLFQKKGT